MNSRVCANGALCEGWRPSGAPGMVRDYNVYFIIVGFELLSGEQVFEVRPVLTIKYV